ncbi:Facilitated trehalose transporter Tret1 [Chionoecetes opilio]|uniref:Facilitated trehalose transporter Tret1 n=1 Tax=Chionoecetes opilio TaxID=41210 RepID=A0A8J4YK68_CHIOP|nr:Facilitated trehalose transporter Tret1 [Chionoecetes opilio]
MVTSLLGGSTHDGLRKERICETHKVVLSVSTSKPVTELVFHLEKLESSLCLRRKRGDENSFFIENNYWWVSLVGLIACIFAMNLGIETLPWQLSSEYFPTIIRSQAMSVSIVIGCILASAALQLYSLMNVTLTTAGLFWTYAAVSGFGVVFSLLCVPETAGKMVG